MTVLSPPLSPSNLLSLSNLNQFVWQRQFHRSTLPIHISLFLLAPYCHHAYWCSLHHNISPSTGRWLHSVHSLTSTDMAHQSWFRVYTSHGAPPLHHHVYIQSVRVYSGTSHNGPSERRTTSVQRTKSVARIEITTAIIHSQPPRNGLFSIPDSGQNWRSITAFSVQNCLY